jgi:hypothetical protein
MKKITSLLLFLTIGVATSAQRVTLSEPIVLRNDIAYHILGEMGGHTLLFRDRSTIFEVVGLNKAMKESWTKGLELDRRMPKVLDILPDDGYFTLFYQFKDRTHTKLKAHRYGPGANLLDSVMIVDLGNLFYTPGFMPVYSEDKSKTLLFFTEKQDVMRAVCFDNKRMELLWQTVVSPQDFNFYQNFLEVLVDNDGDMTIVTERDNYRTKREEHFYEFFHYDGLTDQLSRFGLPMPDQLTFDVIFTIDPLNKRLVGTGLYSEKNLGRSDGFFYINIDPDDPEDYVKASHEFPEEFVVSLLGKEADKTKGVPEGLLRDIVLRKDGGVLLIGELSRTFERNGANVTRNFYDGNGRFSVDYYYDEIFVLSIHPDGKLHWSTVMHKKQYSQDDDGIYSSFFVFKTASSLRFLFNDEIKYENTVSEYVLRGKGRFDRNSLMSTENLKLRLRFRDAMQIDANTLLIPSERRNRLKIARLEYN